MPNFEDVGRVIDREMENLRKFIAAEVKPTTERQLVAALRAASKSLGELAQRLKARGTPPAGSKDQG